MCLISDRLSLLNHLGTVDMIKRKQMNEIDYIHLNSDDAIVTDGEIIYNSLIERRWICLNRSGHGAAAPISIYFS